MESNLTCTDALIQYRTCESNSVITNQETCFRMNYWNTFQLDKNQYAYAFLYFDSSARSTLFNQCVAQVSNFNLSETQFSQGFQFNFGRIF